MIGLASSKTLNLTKPILIAGIVGGLGCILLVGLLSGLVGRPNNCVSRTTLINTTPAPQTTPTKVSSNPITSTSTTTTPITTASTTTTSTTTTTTTTTTTRTSTSSTTSSTMRTTQTTTTTVITQSTTSPRPTTTGSTTSPIRTIPEVTTLTTSLIQSTTPEPLLDFRLSPNTVPVKYEILIKTDFNPFDSQPDNVPIDYDGEVAITFQLTSSAKQIILHADQTLTMKAVNLMNLDTNAAIAIQHRYYDEKVDLYQILTSNGANFSIAQYKLTIKFMSETKLDGFFKTNYVEFGTSRTMLATRFYPIKARTAFPCFDEPSFKAEFDITLEHPEYVIGVSNFPGQSVSIGSGRKQTKFQTTFKMSPHLVAWAFLPSDFDSTTLKTDNNLNITIHTRKSVMQKKGANFALEVAKKSIDYFERVYFANSVPVPPKIDIIAVPNFPGGLLSYNSISSSNWGLNGINEDFILFIEQENSREDKQRVALAVANEMAHYWTSNFITHKWWDDVWLSVSAPIFLSYKALSYYYGDWDISDQFVSGPLIQLLWDDSYESTRPLKFPILNPSLIHKISDRFVAVKGTAMLRMLESVVGENEFKNGFRRLLDSKKFGSITSDDLFQSIPLSTSLGITTKNYMEPWLLQKNYPEVAVLLGASSGVSRVQFRQARFLVSDIDIIEGPDKPNYQWAIHLQCKAGGTYNPNNGVNQHIDGKVETFEYFLTANSGQIDLQRRFTWVKCNRDFKGYYVTDYFDNNYEIFEYVLLNNFNYANLSPTDSANLIHNAFEFAYLGAKSYRIPSLLVNYLATNENSLIPWKTFIYHMNKIGRISEHRKSYRGLQGFAIELVRQFQSSNDIWDDSFGTHASILLKTALVDFLCKIQDEQCLVKSTELFRKIPKEYFVSPNDPRYNNTVSPNYRPYVYKYHIQNSNDFLEFLRLFGFYEITSDSREKEYTLDALANTRLTFLIDLLLQNILDKELGVIRREDILNLIKHVGDNPNGRYFAWYFIREYYQYFEFIYDNDESIKLEIANAIKSIVDSFDNILLLEEVANFYLVNIDYEYPGIRIQTIDIITNNILWVLDREKDFEDYFFVISK